MPTFESPAVARGFALWHAAMRWQRTVDAALRPLELTHTQYLVLASTVRAVRQERDGVAQLTIAKIAGLDSATTSALIRKLEERGLIERAIDALDGRRWRILVTQRGRTLLEKASVLVEGAAFEVASRRESSR